MLLAAAALKTNWRFWRNLSNEAIVGKLFEGEMLIGNLLTISLQIFFQFLLNIPFIMLLAALKTDWRLWQNLSNEAIVGKLFEGEMLI